MSISEFLTSGLNKFCLKVFKSMTSLDTTLSKLESRAVQVENLISTLKAEVLELQKAAEFSKENLQKINNKAFEEMKIENGKLRREVQEWKQRLIQAETKLGIHPVQSESLRKKVQSFETPCQASNLVTPIKSDPSIEKNKAENIPLKLNNKPQPKAKKEDELPVDVRRLDIRVGKIINVKKHPDADSLYVEEIDLGEEKCRTVVSGLVKFVPIEAMQNRLVVALCNLKPAKMRGVVSEAMVLCASTPEKVEVLIPPNGSIPGDRITVEGFPGEPDPVLNPKKKIFETVSPDLKTNEQKFATYKGVPLTVSGKGVVVSETLTNVQIK